MKQKGILLTGPGAHTNDLALALHQLGYLEARIHYYPDWVLERWDGTKQAIPLYRRLAWLLWAFGRRLPVVGRYDMPQAWQLALYDFLACRHFPMEVGFLWAWSGTSLHTMRKARNLNLPVFLEFPASHPAHWNNTAAQAYRAIGGAARAGKGSFLPAALVRRQLAELELADKIIVLSSFVHRQMIVEGISLERLWILPLGIDEKLFSPAPRLHQRPFRFLYVGRINPLKGIHHLLAAWKKLRLPNAELWLVGTVAPEMRSILAAYEGLYRYWGAWERSQLVELYRQATALVFPTLLDSFGLVILEAMASGLPVIATEHSGAPDILSGLPGPVPIPTGSEEALMSAMEALYRAPDLADLSHLMRQRVEQKYTFAHYTQRVAEFLEKHLPHG